jgi:gamma-glutamyltranspeptidase / glutathione hydrolase
MRRLAAMSVVLLILPGNVHAATDSPVAAGRGMVIASDRAASQAGLAMLRKGGSAADAAVAAALVLTVVAPQSASPGGVAAALAFQAQNRDVTAWDGSAVAPAAAGPDLFLDRNGAPMKLDAVRPGGRAVAAPGMLPMLEALHRAQGRLSWADVVAPAAELADKGFAVSPELARALAENRANPPPRQLVNVPLADALRQIAAQGANAVARGPIASDIATTVRNDASPGLLTADDLAAYPDPLRKPLCAPYHGMVVCAPGSPSLGGVELLRSLEVLDRGALPRLDPAGAESSTMLLRAWLLGRQAVRGMADEEFAPDALGAIYAPDSLAADATALGQPWPNKSADLDVPPGPPMLAPQDSGAMVLAVDADGNAVSLTLSLHSSFGSRLLVHGFALNDSLAGFAAAPSSADAPAPNRVEGGKRPLEAMTPVIVLDQHDHLRFVLGAEDGEQGAALEAQMLLRAIDFHQSPGAVAAAPVWRLDDRALNLEDGVGARLVLDQMRQSGLSPRLVPRSGRAALIAWFETGAEGVPTMPGEMGSGRQ